jgi:phosphoenolpyruvate carboxykinase (GTP)
MGKKLANPPKIFHVNWFRTDENGEFLWPGFGENLRVLDWIVRRCCDDGAGAKETPIGSIPREDDLDMSGLNVPNEAMDKLLSILKEDWAEEMKSIESFFTQFGDRLPKEMWDEYRGLKKRFELK